MLTIRPYTLHFRTPWRYSGGTLDRRDGLLVVRATPWGDIYSDCAPLPGFSAEALDDCRRVFRALGVLDLSFLDDPDAFDDVAAAAPWPAAVRAALECLHLGSLCAQGNPHPLWGYPPLPSVPVQAVTNSPDEARTLASLGFRTLKIKLGMQPIADELDRLRAIRNAVGNDVVLRGDANGAWDLETAQRMLRGLAGLGLELVEEPVRDPTPDRLAGLRGVAPILIAADESARDEASVAALVAAGAVDAVVLKPMLTGGPLTTLRIARAVDQAGLLPIISSSLESNVGLRCAFEVARRLPAATAHGLATAHLFHANVGDELPVRDGHMTIASGAHDDGGFA